jgi:hypothetical protein
MSKKNRELNSLSAHLQKSCSVCGRNFPETVLNIEGTIHHKESILCIDRKSCEREKRRKNKRINNAL